MALAIFAVAWLVLAAGVGLIIGAAVRLADQRERTGERTDTH